MVQIDVGDPKSARELLCRAQHALIHHMGGFAKSEVDRLGNMIDQLDVMRPLGPDGKHGNRHTDNCGCEDIEIDWRAIPGFRDYEIDSTGRVRDRHDKKIMSLTNKLVEAKSLVRSDSGQWLIRSNVTLVLDAFPEIHAVTQWPLVRKVD